MTEESGARSFCLIDGVFLPEEARQVLMTLIHDKISFHQRNDWSRRERLGETDTPGGKRIAELQATREALDRLLSDAESSGRQLIINCDIAITMQPQ